MLKILLVVTDKTTAAGMSAEYVACQVLSCVQQNQAEVLLAPLTHRLAILLRTLTPKLYFHLMSGRARREKREAKRD